MLLPLSREININKEQQLMQSEVGANSVQLVLAVSAKQGLSRASPCSH
jgi:hypothetical protein